MSADFYYEEELAGEVPPVRKAGRGIKFLIIAAAALIAAEAIWIFVVQPCMPLAHIDIKADGISRAEVVNFAGLSGLSWVRTDTDAIKHSLESHWAVESASVKKSFPDTLGIDITPRRAVAASFTTLDGKAVPVYFDREGVIINVGGRGVDGSLPVVSGILPENPIPGARIPAQYLDLAAALGKIAEEDPALLTAVSEIVINKKAYNGFDLALYPVHNPVKVRLEKDISGEGLRYLLLMLDVLAKNVGPEREIDFRTGSIASYMVKDMGKEASSGQ